ncbi:uncharacterized protein LOC111629035 [Centruroides sculpturatus]|uniref:uncharacterized protein LOC111629035 n=1 Tax=Centruroides sculpturatus TaxID=218467 RepID=UPI000C6DD68B|nr:uncharacterized protein LOC111629035 [Centruroides sculpturatus]
MKERKGEEMSRSEEIASRVLKMPEIVHGIFKYMSDVDLQQCGQVCAYWKEVVDGMLFKRIPVFRKKIPISMLNTLADNSEKLRFLVNYGDNFHFQWFYLKPRIVCHSMCPRCPKQFIPRTDDELFDAVTFFKENKNKENVQLPFNVHPSTEDEIEINIAMFPSVPGFNIRHFSFTIEERNKIIKEKMPYVSKLLKIPEEELKCVIGIKDYGIHFYDDGTGAYTTYTLEREITRGIAFYGERVQAVSLYIEGDECDFYSVKQKLERLKFLKSSMVQERCFAYIFRRICKTRLGPTLEAFKATFPFATFVDYIFSPQFEVLNPLENYNFDCIKDACPCTHVARMVFIWYD